MRRVAASSAATLFALVLCACEAKSSPAGAPTRDAPPPSTTVTPVTTVTIAPTSARVAVGASVTFSAVVTGGSTGPATWTVESGGGTISPGGVYTAPMAPGTYRVRATSASDPQVFAEADVTVLAAAAAVSVRVTPSRATMDACRTLDLHAEVANAPNPGVIWEMQEGAAGGSISAQGTYTAPEAAGVYHVVARSEADRTVTAVAEVVVNDRVLQVIVSPTSALVPAGRSVQLAATVVTTCRSYVAGPLM